MENAYLRRAGVEDEATCMRILEEGRAFQRSQGFVQWSDGYPALCDVRSDIAKGIGHLLMIDGQEAGYVCLDPDGEPEYPGIRGAWHRDEPYIVIRRISFSSAYAGRGLSRLMFSSIDRHCLGCGSGYLRVNTGKENLRMQHALSNAGYEYCGIVVLEGIERLAYDRTVDPDMVF